jgi:hypothetical protein
MPTPSSNFKLSEERELDRILTLQEVKDFSTLSVDSLKRYHADKVVWLSPRRCGMRLRDALKLGKPP